LDDLYARFLDGGELDVDRLLALVVDVLVSRGPRHIDYSGTAVAIVGERVRAPLDMLVRIATPILVGIAEQLGYAMTIKSAKKILEKDPKLTRQFLEMALADRVVLLGGSKPAMAGVKIAIGDDPVIELDRETAEIIGARTGELVSMFLPISDAGQFCAKHLSARSTPLSGMSSWVADVIDAPDPKARLLDHARRGANDPCTWPIAALLVGGYPFDRTAPPIELGPAPVREEPPPVPHDPMFDRSLDDFELSVRTAKALQKGNIRTVRDLVQRTEADLLKMNDFSRKSLKEVKEVLAEVGLTLGMRLG
jgi:hypothetical protein